MNRINVPRNLYTRWTHNNEERELNYGSTDDEPMSVNSHPFIGPHLPSSYRLDQDMYAPESPTTSYSYTPPAMSPVIISSSDDDFSDTDDQKSATNNKRKLNSDSDFMSEGQVKRNKQDPECKTKFERDREVESRIKQKYGKDEQKCRVQCVAFVRGSDELPDLPDARNARDTV